MRRHRKVPARRRPGQIAGLATAAVLMVGGGRLAACPQDDTLRVSRTVPTVRDTLFLVGDSRIDAALSRTWRTDPALVRRAWRRALDYATATPRAVFVAAGAANYQALETQAPEVFASVRAATLAESWEPVGGWWVQADPRFVHGESLVRQGLYGQRFFERDLGIRASVAWLPDVLGYPPTLPQILSGAGLDGLVAGRVAGSSTTAASRGFFFWEGNDRSSILAVNPTDYGDFADFEFEFPGPAHSATGETGRHGLGLYGVRDPESAAGAPADDAGQPDLPRAQPPTRPAVVLSSSAREAFELAFRSLSRQHAPSRIQGALPAPGPVALPPVPGLLHRISLMEADLQAAEALAAVASGLPGASAYPRGRLERAWRQLLSAQAHDLHAGTPNVDALEAVRTGLDSARTTTDSIIEEMFAAVRAEMDTRDGGGGAYVLFNPLGYARSGASLVELGRPRSPAGRQTGRRSGDVVLLEVPDIPALGAVVIPMGPDGLPEVGGSTLSSPAAGDLWMENSFLRVEIDPASGAVARILDKANGRQALRPGGRANVLLVTEDSVTRSDPEAMIATDDTQEITQLLSLSTSVTARAATISIVRGWGSSIVRQELVLSRSAAFLDVRTVVEWRDGAAKLEVAFEPAAGQGSSITSDVPYGSMDRTLEDTGLERSRDSGLGEHRWVDVSSGGYGLSIFADGRQTWRGDPLAVRMELIPTAHSTAVRDSLRVEHRFALYPHGGSWLDAGTHRLAAEYGAPLLAGVEPTHGGRLGERFSLFASEHAAVSLEWVKRAEEGAGLVLRLVEWAGVPAEATVHSGCPRVTARRANLLEDSGEDLLSNGAEFRIRLHPYEIATAVVDCAP